MGSKGSASSLGSVRVSALLLSTRKKGEGRSSPWDLEASAFQIVAMLHTGKGSWWGHGGTGGALGAGCWAAGDEVLLRRGSVLIEPIKLMLCVRWLGVSVCIWGIPDPVAVGLWLLDCCIPLLVGFPSFHQP